MIMDASPLQLTFGTLGLMLVALVFLYIASRLMAWGAARSWFDFWKDKNKGGKQ
jgi:hypothetical protein